MKHGTMLITIALLFSGVSLAQERVARPALRTGDGILGPQLIAWSEMQKPQPVPQRPEPVPVPDSNADKQAGPTEDTPNLIRHADLLGGLVCIKAPRFACSTPGTN